MKLVINKKTDQIISAYKNDDANIVERPDRYIMHFIVVPDKKIVPKSVWQQLKDDDGNLLWEECMGLKPLMGFVVAEEETITIFNHPNLWTLDEIVELNGKKKKK